MQMHNGMDDRSGAWLFTCQRWLENNVYIVLPINPSEFEVSNPVRGTKAETQRGNYMYVHRNPRSASVIAPCNYTFQIPSGLILPQFNDEHITEARKAALEIATTPSGTDADIDLGKFSASRPSSTQTKDYAGASHMYYQPNLIGRNIPQLYDPAIPIGIQNFYAFLMLADEQQVYTDNTGTIKNNKVIIYFNEPELPSMTFYGWWDSSGISYSEDVDNHGQFDLNFSIFVTGSNPSLGYNNFAGLMSTYKASVATKATSIDLLRQTIRSVTPTQLGTTTNVR